MFFSAKQFHSAILANRQLTLFINAALGRGNAPGYSGGILSYATPGDAPLPTLKDVSVALKAIKQQIVERKTHVYDPQGRQCDNAYLTKFCRPWDIVPELKNYRAPEGDFGVGVEVEMAFVSLEASRQVANHIKDWKYIALDYEGGNYPIEATFPPAKYSTFNGRSQVCRYLDYLKANESLCIGHDANHGSTGTHVNVSRGGGFRHSGIRCSQLNEQLQYLSYEQNVKYFGRSPYGYANSQTNWIEYKLFKSTLDSKRLRQYVDIAVALTDLMTRDNERITFNGMVEALELGYNKSVKVAPARAVAANVSVTAPSLSLAA